MGRIGGDAFLVLTDPEGLDPPAASVLDVPHWRSDARGVVTGLTRYVTKAHLARAVLEATSRQTREVVDAVH